MNHETFWRIWNTLYACKCCGIFSHRVVKMTEWAISSTVPKPTLFSPFDSVCFPSSSLTFTFFDIMTADLYAIIISASFSTVRRIVDAVFTENKWLLACLCSGKLSPRSVLIENADKNLMLEIRTLFGGTATDEKSNWFWVMFCTCTLGRRSESAQFRRR